MYWGQVSVALTAAIGSVYYLTDRGFALATAVLIGICTYAGVRWLIAWGYRTRHWYNRGSYNVDAEKCPNCNARRYRQSEDWILRCHKCGWTAGWPLVRWVTRSVPAVQLRRTIVGPKLVVVVVAASLVLSGATAGLTVGAMQKSIAGLTAEDTTLGGDPGPRAGQGPNATGTPSHSPAQTTRTRSADDAGLNRTKIELLVHKFVNQERRERGLEPLDFDQQLQKIARYHSRDMATHRYFAHTAPDGETMGDRYEKFGYSCRISIGDNRYMTGAENIAYTYAYATIDTKWGEVSYNGNETQIARGLVKQWMHSPGHRKNILKPYWENEGIGVYIIEVGSKTRVYATQNFC